MEANRIKCKHCGLWNDVVALECRRCKGSLVDYESEQWATAREEDASAGEHAERVRSRRERIRRYVILLVVLALLGGGVWLGVRYITENVYVFGEPQYDGETTKAWLVRLKSPDHYMRRRASQAIEVMADEYKKPTVREILPALREAERDEDDIVRFHIKNALATIAKTTGIQ